MNSGIEMLIRELVCPTAVCGEVNRLLLAEFGDRLEFWNFHLIFSLTVLCEGTKKRRSLKRTTVLN